METKPVIYSLSPATAISPIDGRYHKKTQELSQFFSEMALMRFRLLVEVEWLIFLAASVGIIRKITSREEGFLRGLYLNFSEESFIRIKALEKVTNHDVNAVVRWLQEVVRQGSLADLEEFVHIGLTSEDINNTAFAFMLSGGVECLTKEIDEISCKMSNFAGKYIDTPLLAHTHGQPASPTTVGWEIQVYEERIRKMMAELIGSELLVKFGGATGGHNALNIAWPEINWRLYSEKFIKKLNKVKEQIGRPYLFFIFNPYSTQIENHDTYAKLFGIIERINTALIGFNRDMWTYISMKIFVQTPKAGETGSSTMPHKVNPIDFENSEGNLGIANALFRHFSEKLPISRLQRDLTDSTVIRNFGPAFAHTLLAWKSLGVGLEKVYVNTQQTELMLEQNWAVLAEPIQTILRREGIKASYDLLKDLTRGKAEINQTQMLQLIDKIAIENNLRDEVVDELRALSPRTYIGYRRID